MRVKLEAAPARRLRRAGQVATVAAAAMAMLSAEALAYSKKVENACRGDYERFCPAYKVGSPALRDCITLAGKRASLSPTCFNALVDAGLVPRKYLKKRY